MRPRATKGASTFEVIMLSVIATFFVIAAAPLLSRFFQVRSSADYLLRATVFAQDIMEHIRGKSFEELSGKIGDWRLNCSDLGFLYDGGSCNATIFSNLPPGAQEESRVLIKRLENSNLEDILIVEVRIVWKESLRLPRKTEGALSGNSQTRTYSVATLVYREGIYKLRRGGI